jgi:hypothetical protein
LPPNTRRPCVGSSEVPSPRVPLRRQSNGFPGERKGASRSSTRRKRRAHRHSCIAGSLIDGRHLGCSGSRSFSRTTAGGGPAGFNSAVRRFGGSAPERRCHPGPAWSTPVFHVEPRDIGMFIGAAGLEARAHDVGSPGELVRALMANERRSVGLSSRRLHELATGGVRADRVGAKLSPRAIASRGAVGRETDGPCPVTPRPALPARGGVARRVRSGGMSGADVGGWGSGSNRRRAPTAVLYAHGNDRKSRRDGSRVRARSGVLVRGAGDRAVVLTG